MGMLTSISLENYKCFEKLDDLHIAPLTVLCGVNSSGKSSIIKSLLMLKQSYENTHSSSELTLNGEYVKCGRFADISTKNNCKPVTFTLSYELRKPGRYNKNVPRISKFDVTAFKNLNKMFNMCNVDCFRIKSSVTIEESHNSRLIDNDILLDQTIDVDVISCGRAILNSNIELHHLSSGRGYELTLTNIPNDDTGEIVNKVTLRNAACYFENFTLVNAFSTNIAPPSEKISGLLANVYLIFKMNTMQFRNLHYLAPLRGYPQRNYLLDNESEDVGISGEFTPYIMNKNQRRNVYGFFPPKDDVVNASVCQEQFNEFIESWMEYLHFGKYSLESSLDSIQLSIENYNVSNVGFGVSQVLPIIVSGITKRTNEFLLLEQPEIHLHPRAQMNMADFLLSMAMCDRGVIVETHSDHIINRLVRRMMEDSSLKDRVRIYFFDQSEDGITTVEEIKVDDVDGAICDNPNFFYQFADETMKIVDTGYKNSQKG